MKVMSLRSIVSAVLARIGVRTSVAILAVILAALSYFSGAYTRVEGKLADFRDSRISIPSSESVVLVGLDEKTFASLGGLPLRRSYFASALSKLNEAGAKRIYIDIFFQAASNEENDKQFEDAIQASGTRLALPQARLDFDADTLSQPIDRFAEITQLVAADMQINSSHLVVAQGREKTDNAPAPSAANWLVHGKQAQPGVTAIDVRVDLDSIPRVSFLDILHGDEQAAVQNKLVIVGVTAPNILQPLVSPKYGVIERTELLALAAETELLPQKPRTLSWGLQLGAWLALSLGLAHVVGWARPPVGFACTLATLAAIIAGAIYLQASYAMTFNFTIPLVTAILTFAGISIAEKPSFRSLKTLLQSVVKRVDLSLAKIFSSSTDAIVTFSPDGRILAFNEAAEKMLGFPAEAVKGRNLQEVLPGSADRLIASMQQSQPGRFETTFESETGKSRHVDLAFNAMPSDEGWIGYASLRDITDLKEREIHLERQAKVDALTGLPNRMAFEQTLQEFADSDSRCTIMLLDLNRFKQVNDTLGHAVGDELLKAVATRFTEAVGRAGDVFRLGGDEFTIVLDNVEQRVIESLAQHLVDSISNLNRIGDHSIDCGTSIGIAMHPADGTDINEVVEKADHAMYEAKRGGTGYQFASSNAASPAITVNTPAHVAGEPV
ncbi:MAG: diguanylate cyclase domain-containing protein [Aureliella sp.]